MEYALTDFLMLLGSLGLFIYGMKIMSEGLQKASGEKLRNILRGMTSTRISGIMTGFLTTTLVQSSSATTVMVVSFVNAGLLTLTESMGVIMGANIGTTITAWIISIFGFKVKIKVIAIILIGIVFPFLFSKKDKYRNVAEFFMGFGILFIGLDFIKSAVPDIKNNPGILEFLLPLVDKGFLSTILFVIIGTLLTIVIQSSSATMAVTLVMLAQGWITFPIAAAMVLGENIGTTVTANIAAMVGNVHAKRAARFHFFFNIIGVIWMMALLTPYLLAVDWVLSSIVPNHISSFENSQEARENATLALSLFHSSFNILNVILVFGFVPMLERVVIKLQPSKGEDDELVKLQYISSGVLSTPELSIAEARKELQNFGKLIDKIGYNVHVLLFEKHKNKHSIADKVYRREEITDEIELELVKFLTKVSEEDLSTSATQKIPAMLSMANDLERIADIFVQMTKNYERMEKQQVKFDAYILQELKQLFDLISDQIKLMRKHLGNGGTEFSMQKVLDLEESINSTRRELRKSHFKRLEKNVYPAQSGVIYLDFVNRAERIGDHLVNVNEAIAVLN